MNPGVRDGQDRWGNLLSDRHRSQPDGRGSPEEDGFADGARDTGRGARRRRDEGRADGRGDRRGRYRGPRRGYPRRARAVRRKAGHRGLDQPGDPRHRCCADRGSDGRRRRRCGRRSPDGAARAHESGGDCGGDKSRRGRRQADRGDHRLPHRHRAYVHGGESAGHGGGKQRLYHQGRNTGLGRLQEPVDRRGDRSRRRGDHRCRYARRPGTLRRQAALSDLRRRRRQAGAERAGSGPRTAGCADGGCTRRGRPRRRKAESAPDPTSTCSPASPTCCRSSSPAG